MDSLTLQYRQIIINILQEYAEFLDSDRQIQVELILDEKCDRYLLVENWLAKWLSDLWNPVAL